MMSTRTILAVGAALSICVQTSFGQTNPGLCPEDNGKYRTTSAGTFLITSGMRNGADWLNPAKIDDKQPDFASCIDACASKPGCEAVDYNKNTGSCAYVGKNYVPALSYGTWVGCNARKQPNPAAAPAPAAPAAPPASQGRPKPGPKPDPVDAKPPPIDTKPPPAVDPVNPGPQKPVIDPIQPDPETDGNPVFSMEAMCVKDHGKVFITNDGSTYKLQCAHLAPGTSKIGQPTTATSFADCMEKCSANTRCNSVQYTDRVTKPTTEAVGTCQLYKESLDAKTADQEHDYAAQVDPPVIEDVDAPTQLCSTECPFADGMTYTTSYSESFKMDCAKRHGTKVLTTATAENFQDCMELCGAMVACHSVDYQAGKQKCYLGSHHGNPLIDATSYMSAHSIGCAGACGGGGCCGGGGNSTARKSITSEPSPLPDTSCGNEGLDYAIYANQKNGANQVYNAPKNTNFDPALFKTVTPYVTGSTTKIGVANVNTGIYGNTAKDPGYVTVNHKGYIYAHLDGEYTFSAPGVDDSSLLWVGDKAFTGWTRANADIDQAYISGGSSPAGFKATFVKGKYYPIRNVFANSGGAGFFIFKILAPDGTVVVDDKTESCPYLVQFGCKDSYNAPGFAEWGRET